MWKSKKEVPKETEESLRDDFFAGPGKKIVRVELGLTKPPDISFELSADKKEKNVSGSYIVIVEGTIKPRYGGLERLKHAHMTVLEGKRCEIIINQFGGAAGEETYQKGFIGGTDWTEWGLRVTLDTKAEFVRDLVGLINLHGLAKSQDLCITMDLIYPRSVPLKEVTSFEVVRLFANYDDESS